MKWEKCRDNLFFKSFCYFRLFSLDGYCYKFNQQLVTVWSAPNYCNRGGNLASGNFYYLINSILFIVYLFFVYFINDLL